MNSFRRVLLVIILTATAASVFGKEFAHEMKDYGVKPTTSPRRGSAHARTPLEVPGATRVTTIDLKEMIAKDPTLPLIDVLGRHSSLKGAVSMAGAGDGALLRLAKERFPKVLDALTAGDKSRPIVFFCLNAECWLSYNASLHAINAGYKNVLWYRGGIDAWKASSGEMTPLARAPGW